MLLFLQSFGDLGGWQMQVRLRAEVAAMSAKQCQGKRGRRVNHLTSEEKENENAPIKFFEMRILSWEVAQHKIWCSGQVKRAQHTSCLHQRQQSAHRPSLVLCFPLIKKQKGDIHSVLTMLSLFVSASTSTPASAADASIHSSATNADKTMHGSGKDGDECEPPRGA